MKSYRLLSQNASLNLCSWALLGLIAAGIASCSSAPYTTTSTMYSSAATAYLTPPSWAPAATGINQVRYYYLPDCDSYYDASTQQFTYFSQGSWISSTGTPPACATSDLSTSYIVLLNRNTVNPWLNASYYRKNYPIHSYDEYGNIVVSNHLIPDMPTNYTILPRAFNENANSLVVIEQPVYNGNYGYVTREIPMSSIATYMPPESKTFNYGSGYRSR
ncbi:MAG: hypothetical protein Q8922_14895 [Bacteroidota bacterium]|nr:hypothetical protein [Bacteroidota bacterium]MDP4232798.1 hypothetical protein [Bacteroidota bacterium]MDP4242521.1 hypothetical protein [Bacteroidota bacterium]MDP4289204.1 hypothetical protein [Bacteroidota bacterium]